MHLCAYVIDYFTFWIDKFLTQINLIQTSDDYNHEGKVPFRQQQRHNEYQRWSQIGITIKLDFKKTLK